MNLEDFRLADCSLFRTPPIDVTAVQRALENALVDAWKQGYSADQALSNVLDNQQIIGSLAEKVSGSLEFQRETALQGAKASEEQVLARYETERQARLQEVATLMETERKKQTYEKTSETLVRTNSSYSASQQKLEEMRARVRERLKEVGGVSGFQTLEKIKAAVSSTAAGYKLNDKFGTRYALEHKPLGEERELLYNQDSNKDGLVNRPFGTVKDQDKAQAEIKRALKLATSTKKIDPLNHPEKLEKIVGKEEKITDETTEKGGLVKRSAKGVWKVLNMDVKDILFYKLF